MNEILLFEDKKERLIKYCSNAIDNYTFLDIIYEPRKDLLDEKYYKNTKLIIFHESFPFYKNRGDIERFINTLNIPKIIFSGGTSEDELNKINENLYIIKDYQLYKNIIAFLSFYNDSNKINYNIITYGNNYYNLVLFKIINSLDVNVLKAKYFIENTKFEITENMVEDFLKILKNDNNLFNLLLANINKRDFSKYLKDLLNLNEK